MGDVLKFKPRPPKTREELEIELVLALAKWDAILLELESKVTILKAMRLSREEGK